MIFGMNEAGRESCVHCRRRREDCGWTLWMSYEDLPRAQKGVCSRMYSPKIVNLIRTKWPGAEVEFGDVTNPPAV